MQYIKLTQNKSVMVDDSDYEWLSQWKWHFDNHYAARTEEVRGKTKKIYMHRQIMGFPKIRIDHEDRNKLNCQRYNLRPVDARINTLNSGMRLNNTSGHKGLIWCKDGRWKAEVYSNGKAIARYSKDKVIAIELLRKLRLKHYGELA